MSRPRHPRLAAPLALSLALAAPAAWGQEAEAPMEGMDMTATSDDPGMQALMGAMSTMMDATPTETSGDLDADFLLMMIPHHQSAIDMARVELEMGDDPEVQAMAREIINAQEAEIAEMRAMLDAMGQ